MYKVIRVFDAEKIRKYAIEFTDMLHEPCNPDYYISRWKNFLKDGTGVVWGLTYSSDIVGGIGGIVAPDLLSGLPTLVELFWYVAQEHRLHGILLFKTMEKYVTDNKLRWAMVHMERSMPDKLKSFYISRGFRLLETHWIKGE